MVEGFDSRPFDHETDGLGGMPRPSRGQHIAGHLIERDIIELVGVEVC